jgi:hypothetical protein
LERRLEEMIGVANAIDAACGEWLETHTEALNLGRFWQGVQPDRCRIFDAASREKNQCETRLQDEEPPEAPT